MGMAGWPSWLSHYNLNVCCQRERRSLGLGLHFKLKSKNSEDGQRCLTRAGTTEDFYSEVQKKRVIGKSAVKGPAVSTAVFLAFLRTKGHGDARQAQAEERGDWIRQFSTHSHPRPK